MSDDFFVDLEKEFDMINEDEPSGGSKFGTLINWSCHDRKFYKREGGVKTDLDPQPKKLLLDFYNLRVGPVNLAKAQFDYVHFNDTIPSIPKTAGWTFSFDINIWNPNIGFCHLSSNSAGCVRRINKALKEYQMKFKGQYDASQIAVCEIEIEEESYTHTNYYPSFKIVDYMDRAKTELPELDIFVLPRAQVKAMSEPVQIKGKPPQAPVKSDDPEFDDDLSFLDGEHQRKTKQEEATNDEW